MKTMNKTLPRFKVTNETQTRFEELYYTLADIYNDYALSCKIATLLGKQPYTIYMRFRQQFVGGSEALKSEMVKIMEQIQHTQQGEAA